MLEQATENTARTREPLARFIRIGTWFLVARNVGENQPFVKALVRELEADARVLDVFEPDVDDYWTNRSRRFPDLKRTAEHHLLTGSDSFQSVTFSAPIIFDVRVPIKNQRPHHGTSDVPTDTYSVAWDGGAIFIAWDQVSQRAPISGGHVVEEILRSVTSSLGCDLYIQSCTPHCDYLFLHRTMRAVTEFPSSEDYSSRYEEFLFPMDPDDSRRDTVEDAWSALGREVNNFGDFKNVGRRLIDIEQKLRVDLAHLLQHVHEKSMISARAIGRKKLSLWWSARHWRRKARALISGVWVSIANIETLRREWAEERHYVESGDILSLLDNDYTQDVKMVNALDVQSMIATVDQVSASLDNRLMVSATALGALAGGIAGGLIALLSG